MHAGSRIKSERLLAVRLAEAVEKQILTLQRAADRRLQRALQRLGQPEQQRVRKVDDVELRLRPQPLEQLVDFLAPGNRARRSASRPSCSPRLFGSTLIWRFVASLSAQDESHSSIEKARRVPEQRRVLLEEHADAAEEDVLAADVLLVGAGRRVDRRQHDVVAARAATPPPGRCRAGSSRNTCSRRRP